MILAEEKKAVIQGERLGNFNREYSGIRVASIEQIQTSKTCSQR